MKDPRIRDTKPQSPSDPSARREPVPSRTATRGRVWFLALAILVYVVIGASIYRSWWSARGAPADLPADPTTIEARIRFDH